MQDPDPDAPAAGYGLDRDALIPTTFAVPARARRLVTVRDAAALPALLEEARGGPLFVLGGGSNVLFTRDYPGTVLRLATRGIELVGEHAGRGRVRVAAGENWDAFVRWSLAQGFAGLENLVLIPGTVGAAPIQNIGAYGVEFSDFAAAVEVLDRASGRFVELPASDCGFAYRNSLFKREPERYVVTAVVLELPRERALRLDYRGVREELAAMGVGTPAHTDVARAVERLRLRKLPDPARLGNAGSFFKNPVVTEARARMLRGRYPDLPVHPAGDAAHAKLSAAWLIEACGFKAHRDGDTGVSEKHALVLVNYGSASGADVWRLAGRIRAAVRERFDLDLEPEPVIV